MWRRESKWHGRKESSIGACADRNLVLSNLCPVYSGSYDDLQRDHPCSDCNQTLKEVRQQQRRHLRLILRNTKAICGVKSKGRAHFAPRDMKMPRSIHIQFSILHIFIFSHPPVHSSASPTSSTSFFYLTFSPSYTPLPTSTPSIPYNTATTLPIPNLVFVFLSYMQDCCGSSNLSALKGIYHHLHPPMR